MTTTDTSIATLGPGRAPVSGVITDLRERVELALLREHVARLLPADLARGCARWPRAHTERALPGTLPFGLAPPQAAGARVAMYGPWQPHRWLTRRDGALIEHEPGNTAQLAAAVAVLRRWHWAAGIELIGEPSRTFWIREGGGGAHREAPSGPGCETPELRPTAVYVPELHAAGTTPSHVIDRVRELLSGWQLAHRPTTVYPHYVWYWG